MTFSIFLEASSLYSFLFWLFFDLPDNSAQQEGSKLTIYEEKPDF